MSEKRFKVGDVVRVRPDLDDSKAGQVGAIERLLNRAYGFDYLLTGRKFPGLGWAYKDEELELVEDEKPKPVDSYENSRFAKGDRLKVVDERNYTWHGEALQDRAHLGYSFFTIKTDDGSVLPFTLNSDKVYNLTRPDKDRP